ncbi:hypothetical protein LCGC14_2825460, partial [marine sediment metagenome]
MAARVADSRPTEISSLSKAYSAPPGSSLIQARADNDSAGKGSSKVP